MLPLDEIEVVVQSPLHVPDAPAAVEKAAGGGGSDHSLPALWMRDATTAGRSFIPPIVERSDSTLC